MSICSQSGSFVVCKSLLEYFYVFSATWYMMDLSYSFVETWTTSHRSLNETSKTNPSLLQTRGLGLSVFGFGKVWVSDPSFGEAEKLPYFTIFVQ